MARAYQSSIQEITPGFSESRKTSAKMQPGSAVAFSQTGVNASKNLGTFSGATVHVMWTLKPSIGFGTAMLKGSSGLCRIDFVLWKTSLN
jgi:hypothetical protein